MANRTYPGTEVSWSVHVGSDDPVQLKPTEWNIRRTRGEPLSWELKWISAVGDYTWVNELEPLFAIEPYNATWGLLKFLRCSITVGSDTWNSPKLVHLDLDVDVQPDKIVVTLSGTDQTEALMSEDEMMDDVRSVAGDTKSAIGAIEETLAHYGITDVAWDSSFTDFPVQQLHRMGTPLQWIRELLEVRQGWFGWVGDTLTFYAGGVDVAAADVDFSLNARNDLKLLRLKRSAANIYNEVTIQRTSDQVNALNTPQVGEGLGFIDVPLDNQVYNASLKVDLFPPFGALGPATWYDEDDNPVGGPGYHYEGSVKVAKVQFELDALVGAGPFPDPVPYRANVRGTVYNEDLGTFDPEYFTIQADAADQALRGRRPYRQPIEKSSIPNQGVAGDFGVRWVRESLRRYNILSVSCLLDPTHNPGQICAVTLERLGFSSYKTLVESVDWSGTKDSLTEELELARGPV